MAMAMAMAQSNMASCAAVTKQRINIRCQSKREVGRNRQRRALLLTLAATTFVAFGAQAQDVRGYTLATSGLEYCDTLLGSGAPIPKGTLIKAHYTGKLEDGTVFDTSYKRGKPLMFKLGVGEVIKGWDEGILGGDDIPPMLPGGKRKLRIPPSLGYGERGAGCRGGKCVIPPNSVLLFDVELIGKA